MIIFLSCGRLTYYIPYPLSILHPNRPIIHASILSAYFDKPCGDHCHHEEVPSATEPIEMVTSVSPIPSPLTVTTLVEEAIGITSSEPPSTDQYLVTEKSSRIFEISTMATTTDVNLLQTETIDLIEENLIPVDGQEETHDDELETGSGMAPTENYDTEDQTTGDLSNGYGSYATEPAPKPSSSDYGWSIYRFFLGYQSKESNPDSDDDSKVTSDDSQLTTESTLTHTESTVTSETTTTEMAQNLTTISLTRSPPILICEEEQCIEFSTDRLLRARLCCLKEEVGADGEPTAGCATYTKTRCSQMLPMIKCCLKNFSKLLRTFFAQRSSGSSGRRRRPSAPVFG